MKVTSPLLPLRRQIYDHWRTAILDRRAVPGDRVPSTRELAETLGVARATVTDAYEQLIAEGFFEASQGSGTFVCRQLPEGVQSRAPRITQAPPIRLSRYGRELTEDVLRPLPPPGVVHFATGSPDVNQFPIAIWRKLIARHLRTPSVRLLDYAEDPAGYAPLREQVAQYVTRMRAVRCTPEQVIIVNGSQQALDLAVRVLVDPGDPVAFENPGYQSAYRILRAYGVRLHPVPVDEEGLVVRKLPRQCRLIYVTPSHQFPTGVVLSLARRLELLAQARLRNAVILEDDYSSEYRYAGAPLTSLQGLAAGVPIVYMGTFSKVMFPGLRVGYLIVPPALMEPFRCAKWLADRQTNQRDQAALADFLREGHLDRHIRRMRRLYGQRRAALVDALHEHFGDRVEILGDVAGMHVMARFRDRAVVRRALKRGVWVTTCQRYYVEGTAPLDTELMLGFANLSERAIREGIRRLA
jgi:GntR family transcriptional regulator/MocR family aminotransferase